MERVVIYGGSFDPPHNGHIQVIHELSAEFDRVIVSPGFVTPFKLAAKTSSGFDRLSMLSLALDKNAKSSTKPVKNAKTDKLSNVEISTFELDKGGVSYTADLIRHYKKDGRLIYFCIGSEGASTLHKWRESEFLRQNVIFYVVRRKDYPLAPSKGFDIMVSKSEVEDISSSLFKAAYALRRADDLLPKEVLEYIKNNGLYCDYFKIADALKTFEMSEKRIVHTLSAVKCGITLAKIHGESTDKTVTALLLHDIAKNTSAETLAAHKIRTGDLDDIPEDCRHATIGERIAARYLGITDRDVLNSILFHTTARANMSRLEKIVALADFCEKGRDTPRKDEVFEKAKSDLDSAVVMMLEITVEYLTQSNKQIMENSLDALSFYKNLIF